MKSCFFKFYNNLTLRQRIIITCALDSIVLSLLVLALFSHTLFNLEIAISDRVLDFDIIHMTDVMDRKQDTPSWHLKDGDIYRGDFFVGGIEHFNTDTSFFDTMWKKTNAAFFITAKCPDNADAHIRQDISCKPGDFVFVAGDQYFQRLLGKPIKAHVAAQLTQSDECNDISHLRNESGYVKYHLIRDENNNPIGAIGAIQSITTIEKMRFQVAWKVFILIFIVLLLSGIILAMISGKWVGVVTKVQNYLDNVQKGEPTISKSQISHISCADIRAVKSSLEEIAESIREKKRIDSELEFANIIQRNMMPNHFPAFPEIGVFDIYATMTPAKEVGGDLYDFFMPDKSHLAVVIADVSGKGIPAALFMVSTKNLIKNYLEQNLAPEIVFEKVNGLLCEINETGHFVTAWLGLLDITTGELVFVNAGHNPPLFFNNGNSFEWLKQRSGFVLAGMPGKKYKPHRITMTPGSKLLLYTDGVTEAHDTQKNMYGEDRLLTYLNDHVDQKLSSILHGLKEDVDTFVGKAEQFDDITMLMLEYRGVKAMKSASFQTKLEFLHEIQSFARNALENTECPVHIIMKLLLVIEEVFVNIATYAYPDSEGDVQFEIDVKNDQVSMTFTDSGTAFNPLEQEAPEIHGKASARKSGGLGIFMTRKIMDKLEYHYIDGKNILHLIKKI